MIQKEEKFTKVPSAFEIGLIEAYGSVTSVKQGDSIDFHVWTKDESRFTMEVIKKGLNDTIVFSDVGTAEPYNTNSEPWINGCG